MHASQWIKLEHCSSTSWRLHSPILPTSVLHETITIILRSKGHDHFALHCYLGLASAAVGAAALYLVVHKFRLALFAMLVVFGNAGVLLISRSKSTFDILCSAMALVRWSNFANLLLTVKNNMLLGLILLKASFAGSFNKFIYVERSSCFSILFSVCDADKFPFYDHDVPSCIHQLQCLYHHQLLC